MSRSPVTPEQIDAVLPQTQCGLCGYGGCMPYAEALVFEKAAIDLCPPGGVTVLREIAALVGVDAEQYVSAMAEKAKPRMLAVIREDECIGCVKCIQACPVDAILGSAKQLHSVILDECTGCELCVSPCPVDCIEMVLVVPRSEKEEKQRADLARERFRGRQSRLLAEKLEAELPKHKVKSGLGSAAEKKDYVREAVLRAKARKALPGV